MKRVYFCGHDYHIRQMRSNLLQKLFHITLETRKIEKLLPIWPVRGKKSSGISNFDSCLLYMQRKQKPELNSHTYIVQYALKYVTYIIEKTIITHSRSFAHLHLHVHTHTHTLSEYVYMSIYKAERALLSFSRQLALNCESTTFVDRRSLTFRI